MNVWSPALMDIGAINKETLAKCVSLNALFALATQLKPVIHAPLWMALITIFSSELLTALRFALMANMKFYPITPVKCATLTVQLAMEPVLIALPAPT